MIDTLELNEAVAVPVKDCPTPRLVIVSELLEEIKKLKKRVRSLEGFRGDYFERHPKSSEHRRPVETRGGSLDRLGNTDVDAGVLAESVDPEDFVTVRSSRSEAELADAAAVAGDDDTVSVHAHYP